MDALSDNDLALMKFGVGQPVPRKEDPTLLRGEGRYTDDINLPGQAFAVMVRSKIAHGVLKGIDIQAARAMPGVLAVLTHADLDAAGFGPLKCEMNIPDRDGKPMKTPPRPSLAKGKVRYVGEAVACVVAETAVQAKDAAEAVHGLLEVRDRVEHEARVARVLAVDVVGVRHRPFGDREGRRQRVEPHVDLREARVVGPAFEWRGHEFAEREEADERGRDNSRALRAQVFQLPDIESVRGLAREYFAEARIPSAAGAGA